MSTTDVTMEEIEKLWSKLTDETSTTNSDKE